MSEIGRYLISVRLLDTTHWECLAIEVSIQIQILEKTNDIFFLHPNHNSIKKTVVKLEFHDMGKQRKAARSIIEKLCYFQ